MDDARSTLSAEPRDVTRAYVNVGGRAVHYRVAGHGPAVVMLHDSPRSSRLHLDTMRSLSRRFRVFALDTPGYGNSAPLVKAAPTIADFADALGKVLGALGLGAAPIYATHTSAKIALEYAASPDHRANSLILDGLSIPVTAPDPAFIATYMRPFEIEASGGYLAAEWTRTRDMLRWFPWFDHGPAKRMPVARPGDAWISAYLIDFLSAGPSYESAYAAAMFYDPMPALLRVSSPVLVAARSDDVLYPSLDLVPLAANPALNVERLPDDGVVWLSWLEEAITAAVGSRSASEAVSPPISGVTYVDLPHGQMRIHRSGPAEGRPILILSAPTTLHGLAWQAAMADRATLVPELPGFGESDPLPSPTLEAAANALAAMLEQLGCGIVDVLASDFASPLGCVLASRHPSKVASVVLDGCFDLADEAAAGFAQALAPAFSFDSGGGHIHRYWHMLRDAEASWPWHDPDVDAHRASTPILDGAALHDALVGILKQPDHYGDVSRAACLAGSDGRFPAFTQPVLLLNRSNDPAYRGVLALSVRLPQAAIATRPTDLTTTARIIGDFVRRFVQSEEVGG